MVASRKAPQRVRAEIVCAAIEVIGHRGIDGLTHRAVAACAGVSLSSTTYHFASREDIIAAAFRHVVAEEVRAIGDGAAQIEALDQRDSAKVRAAVAEWLCDVVMSDSGGRVYLRAQYELQLYAVSQRSMRDGVRAWQEQIEQIVTRLFATLGALDPPLAAQIAVSAADGRRLAALTTAATLHEAKSTGGTALAWLTKLILDNDRQQ